MTSEGQHAGQQPADATSGAGEAAAAADASSAYGTPPTPDGFPPDSGAPGAPPAQSWGPSGYPNSYGPPPYPPAGTGSPFVVPAVPVRPPSDGGTPGGPLHPGERSRPGDVARPQASSLQAGGPQAGGPQAGGPQAGGPQAGGPQTGGFRPAGPPATGFAQASRATGADVPPEAWAPPPAAPRPTAPPPADAPGAVIEPHPYRSSAPAGPPPASPVRSTYPPAGTTAPQGIGEPLPTRTPFGAPGGPAAPSTPTGFNGFASASAPNRPGPRTPAGPAAPPTGGIGTDGDPADRRAPGVSAFGDQRIRVPGATLTDLPDAEDPGRPAAFPMTGPDSVQAPTAATADRPGVVDGYPARTAPDRASDQGDLQQPRTGRQTSSGLPVRGSGAQPAQTARPAFPVQGGTGFAPRTPDSPSMHGMPRASDGTHTPDVPRTPDSPFGAAPVGGSRGPGLPPESSVPQPRTPAESSAPAGGPLTDGSMAGAPMTGGPGTSGPVAGGPGTSGPVTSGPVASAPVIGTARPVSATASVPVASRVAPPADMDELPPPAAGTARPRIYGRPPQSPSTDFAPPPAATPPVAAPPVAAPPVAAPPVAAPPVAAPPVAPVSPIESRHEGSEDWTAFDGRPVLDSLSIRDGHPGVGPGQATPDRSTSAQPVPGRSTSSEPNVGDPVSPGAAPGYPGPNHPQQAPSPFGSVQPRPGEYGRDGRPPTGRATASARVTPPPSSGPPSSGPPSSAPPFGTDQPFEAGQPPAPSLFGTPAPARGTGGEWSGNPYSEHTTDVAGRGRHLGAPPGPDDGRKRPPADHYSEHTTDMAGRGHATDKPYVPAPALPSMHASAPLVDGFPAARTPSDGSERSGRPAFGSASAGPTNRPTTRPTTRPTNGPTNRPTVTPPGVSETPGPPGSAEPTEQGRFEAFKPEAPAPEKSETPSVRMVPVLLSVVLAAALVVGLAMGLVWLIAPSDSGFDVNAGDCVKRDGDKAVTATCGDPGAFQVLSKVDSKEQCPDPGQPYVLNPTSGGRTQVLCLKPSS